MRQRHFQSRGGGIANQEAKAIENKMQRCRRIGGGGMMRSRSGSQQEAVM
jgi:hypothetical protein